MAYLIGTTPLYCPKCCCVTTFKVWVVSEDLTLASCIALRLDRLGAVCRWKPTSPLVIAVAIARAKASEIDHEALLREEEATLAAAELRKVRS